MNVFSNEFFENRVAVITGGSAGLGYDFCRALTELGSDVFFCGRRDDTGQKAESELGEKAHFIRADLAEPADIDGFMQQVSQQTDKIDFLVNNIAIDDRLAVDDLTVEACDRMWQINLRSYLLTTRAFLLLMRQGTGRSIVNICTTNYMLGLDPFTLYNATKSGIIGFTRSLARELGHEGIRANVLSPGWIMTEKQLKEHVSEQDKVDLLNAQAIKTLLLPEHVTPAVLFLLSPAAIAITGQNIVVDNGKFML